MRFALISPNEVVDGNFAKSSNWQRVKFGRFKKPAPNKVIASSRLIELRQRSMSYRLANWPLKEIAKIQPGIYRLSTELSLSKDSRGRNYSLAGRAQANIEGIYLESIKIPLGKSAFSLPGRAELTLFFRPVPWILELRYYLDRFTGEIPSLTDAFYEEDLELFEQRDYDGVTDAGYL